ncbi:MAG: transporter [Bacteroidia bacterium]
MKKFIHLFFLLIASQISFAQEAEPKKFSEAIEDNSFFIEEAYNQEAHVVQHIFNFIFDKKPEKALLSTFTQEWPVGGQKNQLSYTIPYTYIEKNNTKGIGDIFLNYRYQVYDNETSAFAPRLSLLIPTGNAKNGLGNDQFALQTNLPFSMRVSNEFAFHLNAGITTFFINPKSSGDITDQHVLQFNAGASVICLVSKHFNFFLEALYYNDLSKSEVTGSKYSSQYYLLNPGVRFAIDINKLQIVPGLSFPIYRGDSGEYSATFFYLSFEHPF